MRLSPDVQQVAIGCKCVAAVVGGLVDVVVSDGVEIPVARVPLRNVAHVHILPAGKALYLAEVVDKGLMLYNNLLILEVMHETIALLSDTLQSFEDKRT